MANRMSMYSLASEGPGGSRSGGGQSSQVSTTTLLNAIHNIYLSSQAYKLDAGTSVVVNTWLTASQQGGGAEGREGGTVDAALAARAWEHARRRAEDGCIVLGSLHTSTPSVLAPFLSALPVTLPSKLFKALDAVLPFLRTVTPSNPALHRQTVALGVTLTLSLSSPGTVTAATLALAAGKGIDTTRGLLDVPSEPAGHRAFDVFYYLLTSASTPAEREFLGLKAASSYALLSRQGTTTTPPSYLPTADDAAAADDFRNALKDIGIRGSSFRSFISTLAGILKLGNTVDYGVDEDAFEEICEDVGGLLGIDPEVLARQLTTDERRVVIAGLYEALVDWVIAKANESIASQIASGDSASDDARTPRSVDGNGDTVCITVLEVPDPAIGKAICLRGIFDDSQGINHEMIEDGVPVAPAGSTAVRETQAAVADVGPDLGIMTGQQGRDRQHELERREELLERIAHAADGDDDVSNNGFVKRLLFPVPGEGIGLGRNHGRMDVSAVLSSSRVWYHLSMSPSDDSPAALAALPSVTSSWSAGTVSRQLRAWRLPEWANRRHRGLDFTADFDVDELVRRYAPLGCRDGGREAIEAWALERGWSNGELVVGKERVWMRESAWWEAESMLDAKTMEVQMGMPMQSAGFETGYSSTGSGYFPPAQALDASVNGSRDHLIHARNHSQGTLGPSPLSAPSITAAAPGAAAATGPTREAGDYGLGTRGDIRHGQFDYNGDGEFINMLDPELAHGKHVVERKQTLSRRIWVAFVWLLTFWIPSPLLRYVGRMRRPDVRMAWREKVVLVFLILLLNAVILFWIIIFGQLLCPNFDKAWSQAEVSTHLGADDFWVSVHGRVYDLTRFWRLQHSDSTIETTPDLMQPFAGMNLDDYFVPPLPLTCPGLPVDETMVLDRNNSEINAFAVHVSGYYQPDPTTKLKNPNWYVDNFLPRMREYYKGDLVIDANRVMSEGTNDQHMWFIYEDGVYDLTNYLITLQRQKNLAKYRFLDERIVKLVQNQPGTDITEPVNKIMATARLMGNETSFAIAANSLNCIQQTFYVGKVDFRFTARCQANNWILLAFTCILCAVILTKFLSALQLGSKRRPSPQDKFVICQVPAYTEGEDSLRKALDSLTALDYDNKRKLICVICDGVIVGKGNDRPTPKIVLDILGVDPKVDPPALPFKSVGVGSEQLNYGKVYSGLYEFEGNVVPYLVVVKVGNESEQGRAKPGNRGKRDSQILLMSFLNRVHHRAPMNPLELEMFHQINNVIGVDPELYEYLLMVDADTCVREDSLTRLVAACANDGRIAGICGETSLQNEERSWWTMIQVYEYFISHHLAKAFESLFGSVTCLPGCFSMYRLRTADKGRPLIISDNVIRDYSDCHVDTLHKKNLLSLGEDRYLTTLMTKYFPHMSYKFIPDAYCQTAAPETWSVLLSQRRRWINSTIHNLVELMRLKDMCGFCCFSMRFVVFIDLCGTLILPATCVYLGYLLYRLGTRQGQFPLITLILLAAVYGLQALVFIVKRQWQHIGWMIIYIIAFPIYSFVLPIYSFWNQDNFSWGNTRIVVGEKGDRKIVAEDEKPFDPRSIPLQRWDDYALQHNLPGRRGGAGFGAGFHEKSDGIGVGVFNDVDDVQSVYSSVRQGSFMGMPGAANNYRASGLPVSRGSAYGGTMPVTSAPPMIPPMAVQPSGLGGSGAFARHSTISLGVGPGPALSPYGQQAPHHDNALASRQSISHLRSMSNSPAQHFQQNRQSTATNLDFQRGSPGAAFGQPDDMAIVEAVRAVLHDVDLDSVTKKQVRALVEQRLQTELVGERRTFMDRQIDAELENM